MTRVGLSRFNTVALLTAAGMVVGHWMQPAPGILVWRRALIFLGAMAALGAFRGWREVALHPRPRSRGFALAMAGAFATGAVLLMTLGYVAFHGIPG